MALLLLLGVDPLYPCLLAALYQGRIDRPPSRPGLRLDPHRHLASWDRESGLGWVGMSATGLVAGLVPGPGGWAGPLPDFLAVALAAPDPAQAAEATQHSWGTFLPAQGWILVAGRKAAWLVAGGRSAALELPPGVHLVRGREGLLSAPWPGQQELARPGLTWEARLGAIGAVLAGAGTRWGAAHSAALVAPSRSESKAGRFLFRPAFPAGAGWLDYSNLLARLEE